MKAMMKSLAALFAVAMIFALPACTENKTDSVTSQSAGTDLYSSYSYTASADLALSTICDATLNCDATLINEDFNSLTDPASVGNGKGNCPGRMGENFMQFRKVFKDMQLTKEQMDQIPAFMKEFMECQMQAKIALRQSEMAIIKKANADRAAVLADLKAGNITRAEAQVKIKAINLATREALKNNPDRETALAAMKACRDNLFAEIRGILTADQQAIWDAWVAKLPKP